MADYVPIYSPGVRQTHSTSAAVTGGTLVSVSGDGTVATMAAAGPGMVGVAGHDAGSGTRLTVFTGGVAELVTANTVTAGNTLEAAAGGTVTPHTNGTNDINIVGIALTSAASGAKCRVLMAR